MMESTKINIRMRETFKWLYKHTGRFLLYLFIVGYQFSGAILFALLFLHLRFHYALLIMVGVMLFYRIRLPIEYNGALDFKWLRNNAWLRFVRSTEPWNTTFMEKLSPDEMYLIVGYPHGMIPISWVFFLTDLASQKIYPRSLAADIIMRLPFSREITLLLGGVNASWKSIRKAGEQGQSLFVLPGSLSEMKYNDDSKKVIHVIKRKGFIKAALKYGFNLVPVVGVGVTGLYSSFLIPSEWFKRVFGTYPFVPLGEYEVCFPRTVPVHNVIGRPIHVEKNVGFTEQDVAELSEKYYRGLQEALDHYNSLHSDSYFIRIIEP